MPFTEAVRVGQVSGMEAGQGEAPEMLVYRLRNRLENPIGDSQSSNNLGRHWEIFCLVLVSLDYGGI